jgi:uncharacterized protein YkwD
MPGRLPPSARNVALVVAVLLALPVTAAAQDCPAGPERAAVLGALNAAREHAGVAPVRRRPALGRAACAYAADMVARRFFSHTSPEGEGPADRARASGYLREAPVWSVGEILLWSSKPVFTAADAAAAWLASPPHKAVLLTRGYRDAGVGIVPGDPLGNPLTTSSVTMAVLFGHRRVLADGARRRASR